MTTSIMVDYKIKLLLIPYTYSLFSLDSLENKTIYQTIYGDLCIQFMISLKKHV